MGRSSTDTTVVYAVKTDWSEFEIALAEMLTEPEFFPTKQEALDRFEELKEQGQRGAQSSEESWSVYPTAVWVQVLQVRYGTNRRQLCNLLNRAHFANKEWRLREWGVQEVSSEGAGSVAAAD